MTSFKVVSSLVSKAKPSLVYMSSHVWNGALTRSLVSRAIVSSPALLSSQILGVSALGPGTLLFPARPLSGVTCLCPPPDPHHRLLAANMVCLRHHPAESNPSHLADPGASQSVHSPILLFSTPADGGALDWECWRFGALIKNFTFKSQVIQMHILGELEQTSYCANICRVREKAESL